MSKRAIFTYFTTFTLCAAAAEIAVAQSVSVPPSGDNQKASVSQWIGLVKVNVTYSSPDITGPNGEDRKGKIWGELVPYGLTNLGFGTCGDKCPWRAGANQNTVFTVSHDVMIEGKRLPAGKYGLHMIPGKKQWTVIFSKNTSSWGSYTYDAKEDALRIKVRPKKAEYAHWLTYEFTDRQKKQATVALHWDRLAVPFTIKVANFNQLYVAKMRDELRSAAGFNYQGWQTAANFCLQNKINLKEALKWAENAVSAPYIGQKNFTTLQTLSLLQEANGMNKKAKATIAEAFEHPTATPSLIHQYGRRLLAAKKNKRALEVFKLNARKHPDVWPVNVGLVRGYSAVGQYKQALKAAKKAVKQAPDPLNRKNLKKMVKNLEAGKPVS